MSLETDGVWKANVWASTVWGDCVWYEPSCAVAVTPTPASRESGGGAAGWPSALDYKKKREEQIKDEDEIMRIIMKAFPDLIRKYYG